jgi:hypothetical protein
VANSSRLERAINLSAKVIKADTQPFPFWRPLLFGTWQAHLSLDPAECLAIDTKQ